MTQHPIPKPRFAGTPVELDGTLYIVPPISVGAARRELADNIRMMRESATDLVKAMENGIPIALSAIRRNYPDFSDQQGDDLLDSATLPEVLGAALRSTRGTRDVGEPQPTTTT